MDIVPPEPEPALSQIGAIALLNKNIISFLEECIARNICPDVAETVLGRAIGGKLLQDDMLIAADHSVAVICTNCGDFTDSLEKISKRAYECGQKDMSGEAILLLCCLIELEAKAKDIKTKAKKRAH